jgi:hypothetical protein
MNATKGHEAQPSAPTSADVLLSYEDAKLGAAVMSVMSWGALPDSYRAIGRILRAGVEAVGADELELALRRRRRR